MYHLFDIMQLKTTAFPPLMLVGVLRLLDDCRDEHTKEQTHRAAKGDAR